MSKHKKNFFERLTGSSRIDNDKEQELDINSEMDIDDDWMEESAEEAQLTVDVYQTNDDIIIKAMVSGIKDADLDVSINQEMVTIKGSRQNSHHVEKDNYFYQELFWGSFSRTILLPQEIDPNEAVAELKNGLLTITLPKMDKKRVQKLKIKTSQ